jgi:hypothetical protein
LSGEREAARTLTLLSKPGCHLCHVMLSVVVPVAAARGLRVVEKDVRDDPETARLYAMEIRVLLLDGVEIARHRVTPEELAARLDPADR